MELSELNRDIKFCEDCKHIVVGRRTARCGINHQILKFYDRSCDHFEDATEDFDWDEEHKAFVVR